jgi:hypothetical protein
MKGLGCEVCHRRDNDRQDHKRLILAGLSSLAEATPSVGVASPAFTERGVGSIEIVLPAVVAYGLATTSAWRHCAA